MKYLAIAQTLIALMDYQASTQSKIALELLTIQS